MRINDKVKRVIAFYTAVILFIISLPIILSYSLGYKIDYKKLKIYKTGIIYINTHPSGASVYVNGSLHKDVTPTQIEELKPGRYDISVKMEDYYPWEAELAVRPNMVTRADQIELFPFSREVKRINDIGIKDFVVSDNGYVYYMTKTGLYRSGTDGNVFSRISAYSDWPDVIIGKKFSSDGSKFLYFDKNAVYVAFLSPEKNGVKEDTARVENIFKSPDDITDVFWYPGSNYVLVVTGKDIKAVELRQKSTPNAATLYEFTDRPQCIYYDENSDSLYFADMKTEPDVVGEKNLYRLDLKKTFMDSLKQFWMKEKPKDKDSNEKK